MHIKAGNCARTPKIPCSGDVRGLSWQYFIQSYAARFSQGYAAQHFEQAHFLQIEIPRHGVAKLRHARNVPLV